MSALYGTRRVVHPTGLVVAAVISRFASTFDGIHSHFLEDERFERIVDSDVATGRHENRDATQGWFTTAYFHHPSELRAEFEDAGCEVIALLAIEGPASWMSDIDRWLDDAERCSLPRSCQDRAMSTDNLATNLPYEYAAVAPPGSMVFTAGACPLDADGRVVGAGDHEAQAHRAVDNVLAVLERYGAGPADLVRTTVYVVGPRETLSAVWHIVAGRLSPHRPPSTLLGVNCLGYPEQLVEIDGIAALPTADRRPLTS